MPDLLCLGGHTIYFGSISGAISRESYESTDNGVYVYII